MSENVSPENIPFDPLETNQQPDFRREPPPAGVLRIVPLGGLGEFGKNTLVFEFGDDMILVDCGQKMPEDDMLGIDMVIPDFSYLLDNADRLRGVVLTHGHEDHIGAVPFLVRQLERDLPPIFGAQLTMALIRAKLAEMQPKDRVDLHEIDGGDRVDLGAFQVEFLPVAHSFPQAMALAIHTPVGTVVHTGDYKFDPTDPASQATPSRLEQLGREGVLLLTADSTNVSREGDSGGEGRVREGLRQVLAEAPRTAIVATFSSSLHRVQTVLDLAEELDRQVAVCGFSLERNFDIAADLGLIEYSSGLIRPLHELNHLPPSRRLILTTGSQGEPMSVLSRMALGNFKSYKVQPDDLVVFSSRIIPGNDRPIYRMINHFYRRGARVVTERDASVHASGHAARGDMRRMMDLVRPQYLLPVHGELRQLIGHRDLAVSLGVPEERIFVIENGMEFEVGLDGACVRDAQWSDQVLVDGKMIDAVEEIVLRDRKHLSEDGMVTAILVIDRQSHRIIAGPDIVSRGFVVVDDNEALMQECREVVARTFDECDVASQEEWDVVKVAVRKALR